MAKTSFVDIVPGLEDSFYSTLRSGNRFQFARIVRKITLYSVKRKKGLSARSLLPAISLLWDGLSSAEKTAWTNAGVECNLNGWRLFVKDTSARIKNSLAGVATPSLLHQAWVGGLRIEAPASELKIIQTHPRFYWISRKVTGKKGMYEPVSITEDFALPVTISLNYKSELVPSNGENFAKFYARFWHSYQGADLYTDLEIPLVSYANWVNATATLTTLSGYVVGYDLYIHLKGLTGDLFIDNVEVTHSSQNWARDKYCDDINQGFTRAFYQIPKHWAAVTLPVGASYESVYQDFAPPPPGFYLILETGGALLLETGGKIKL
jgi:hypothetical protein